MNVVDLIWSMWFQFLEPFPDCRTLPEAAEGFDRTAEELSPHRIALTEIHMTAHEYLKTTDGANKRKIRGNESQNDTLLRPEFLT